MVSVRRIGLAALLVSAFAVSLAACSKPQLGGKCAAGQVACVDAKSGLFCGSDSTYKAMTCGGANGCKADGAKVMCDNDMSAVGDGCDTPNDGACSADGKALLQCKNEKFVLIDTCKGPGACKVQGDMVNCDNDIADLGDPCSNKGNFACTSDKGTALRCGDDGKYASIQSCRGPKACRITHDPKNKKQVDIDCDFTVANENDPCFFPGNESCSSDKKTMFTCVGNKYTQPAPCGGPTGCTVTQTKKSAKVTCDNGAPAPDPNDKGDKKGEKKKKH